ncbi:MAG: TetR family transcriptional regulator [Acidimicrobiales bacterium]
MTKKPSTPRPIGRRPGDPDETKNAILDAARHHFGAVGFDRATIRNIAETAEVDPALVIHHFTNKQQLFLQAHQLPLDPDALVAEIVKIPRQDRGEAFARTYLSLFTQPGSPALSMMRAAATHGDAARMMREFIASSLLSHADELVEGADPELRMALIGSHLVGVLFTRELIQVRALADADLDSLVALIAPAIQNYFAP